MCLRGSYYYYEVDDDEEDEAEEEILATEYEPVALVGKQEHQPPLVATSEIKKPVRVLEAA